MFVFLFVYRKPSHPDLKCWRKSQESDSTTHVDKTESTVQSTMNEDNSAKNTSLTGVSEQGERPVCTESKSNSILNGHIEPEDPSQNGLPKVKEERPSTPPRTVEGPGDTNNNIQGKSAPVLSTGSLLMSTVSGSSGRGEGSLSASSESHVESSQGQLDVVKKEEEPLSPIPALVPAGGQTVYMKSESSSDQGKHEEKSINKSDNVQSSVKPGNDAEGTGQPVELKPSVGSARADPSEVKAPPGETTPQIGSDSQVKLENESRNSAISGAATASDVKAENQESVQSLSDDESVGAINNLLDDITEIQDNLEGRMDEIEQQLAGKTSK